ncbi:nuclear transport factor 2 family protein [Amycolatopsis sp. H20-H5]|uniref:nuclear transport factor 2 family protein n=1 Tax=Amycolatopsis sp. H20-H5 TaxID=3046309 RepID=UPI002DB71D9A|nr:nuclear transport factor 2 family protein [Amycolatopsis sp. H20-H5]MEC3975742.1 nuclear transport factor 2 family protein [Amycolatopsis sp. H20-H5]
MSDHTDLSELVLRERAARNHAQWDALRGCFHPDSLVITSWFEGTGPEFVDVSVKRYRPGNSIINRLSPPVVHLAGESAGRDRALVELPSTTIRWFPIDGVEVELTSYMLLVYRAERRDGVWRILQLNAINEADTLFPAIPGDVPKIDRELLAGFRRSYRFLSLFHTLHGEPVKDDLPGLDDRDSVDSLYSAAFGWLESGRGGSADPSAPHSN